MAPKIRLLAPFTALLALLACGDDDKKKSSDESASTSELGALCELLCECDDSRTCESDCRDENAATARRCADELTDFLDCEEESESECDGDQLAVEGCDDEYDALTACEENNGSSDDDDDDGPTRDASPPISSNDGGTTRVDGGSTTTDAGGGLTPARDGGVDAGGGSTDGGGVRVDAGASLQCQPAASDSACTTCGKASCCESLSACLGSTACGQFVACVSECQTDDCRSACIQGSPSGAQLFLEYLECSESKCAAACGG